MSATSNPAVTPAPAFDLKVLTSRVTERGSLWTMAWVGVVVLTASAAFWMVSGTLPFGIVLAAVLVAIAGVIGMGLFAFFGDDEASGTGLSAAHLVEALTEAAAVAALDGRVLAANKGWRAIGGSDRRLPQGAAAPAMFVAMKDARAKGLGRATVRIGDDDFDVTAARLTDDQVLVRAVPVVVPDLAIYAAPAQGDLSSETFLNDAPDAVEAGHDAGNGAFDSFARGAPFGKALLSGDNLMMATVVGVNAAFARLLKASADDLTGRGFGDLLTPSSRAETESRLISGKSGRFDIHLAANPDLPVQMLISEDATGFMVYLFDVSEQKELEQSLAQVQKMQAIGQFAGGVAHDLNNLLTGLKLRIDELLYNHPLGDPSYDGLKEIRQIGTRAEDLVSKLLAFARKKTVKRVTLNIGELVSEFEVFLRRLMREDVKLETDYGRDLPNIHADKSQMEMAVMNLVVNARDAVHASGGGKVRIKTAVLTQGEAAALGWAEAPEQGAALIEVSDNGPGIPPDIMAKVFEPFFTTKPQGEGTGLGLATVYGIVNQADGHITITSVVAPEPNHGAIFRIFLPVKIEVAVPESAPVAPPVVAKVTPKDMSGAGRILFVEDEDIVRGIAARLLRQRGYEVLEAADGEEALEIIEAENGRFDLLISDVIMPGLDGPSMLKRARPLLGNVPVMFISGYAEAEFSDLLDNEANISFLPKPLDIKTLAERVKEQLAA
ncbi:cell cycle histidine kinase CckA [Asticcacaulis endophyticus]|uniref:histidine kinase n=1 Tax=Asticcacaulis endophyticus TaxID=1395890 RepID=A0A918UUI2_9CAUL|nr:PAS domain-containing hybrid sensor histidine kinase/response regulator [Asticcacaulis endophyticus]GGZ33751.1 hybrid sensor histidine kinase/response regulator [Asticcacaulis endophyticus]